MTPSDGTTAPVLREPRTTDAAAVWGLVDETGVLDLNSPYAYLLVCTHHAATSVVAHAGDLLVGFVSAYRLPQRPEVLFVWQVAVAEAARRAGLAKRMLLALPRRRAARGVRFLEATVTPSNRASRRLFESVARSLDAELEVGPGFGEDDFPAGGHEREDVYRIGPLPRSAP